VTKYTKEEELKNLQEEVSDRESDLFNETEDLKIAQRNLDMTKVKLAEAIIALDKFKKENKID